MNEIINVVELVDYLGVSVRQLQNIRKSKSFPSAVRLGKTKLAYRMCDIDEWINGWRYKRSRCMSSLSKKN
jgi:predicted DNA-binding transcriptional regulator AlpA